MTSFISASEIKAAKQLKKEQRRAAREEILREAKESYEKEKKRRESKRERGEDVWIAPAVSERLGLYNESPERKKRRKHKKEHKKHTKRAKKKSKGRKHSESSSASDSADSGEEMWVEMGDDKKPRFEAPLEVPLPSVETTPLKREDWMTMPFAPSELSMTTLLGRREAQDKKKAEERDEVC